MGRGRVATTKRNIGFNLAPCLMVHSQRRRYNALDCLYTLVIKQ